MDAPATTATAAPSKLPADTPTPTSTAATLYAAQASMPRCHVCTRMERRRPTLKQAGPSKMCVLCKRSYCHDHAAPPSVEAEADACEVNHETYFENHRMKGIYPTLESWQREGWVPGMAYMKGSWRHARGEGGLLMMWGGRV